VILIKDEYQISVHMQLDTAVMVHNKFYKVRFVTTRINVMKWFNRNKKNKDEK